MYEIEITASENCGQFDEHRLEEVVRTTLETESVPSAEISVAVVDNATIHELNREYLNHDYSTDVLSFSLASPEKNSAADGNPQHVEGEIIISAEMARERAAEFHWNAEDELVLYAVHGLLHLCGYDDHGEDERNLMREREQVILESWGLKPHYGDEMTDKATTTLKDGASGATR